MGTTVGCMLCSPADYRLHLLCLMVPTRTAARIHCLQGCHDCLEVDLWCKTLWTSQICTAVKLPCLDENSPHALFHTCTQNKKICICLQQVEPSDFHLVEEVLTVTAVYPQVMVRCGGMKGILLSRLFSKVPTAGMSHQVLPTPEQIFQQHRHNFHSSFPAGHYKSQLCVSKSSFKV